MSTLDKTITFDTVRFVTYSEYLSDVNDEFFDNDIDLASGEARKVEFHSRKHTDIIPFQLYIRVNYKSKRMTIEFSSKILFKDYPLLISAQTFRQCLLNIENLNICKLDIDKIIENCYFNKLHITKDVDLKLTRSEEHTSELQSRPHLVCRLLLEKKNNYIQCSHFIMISTCYTSLF